ncbi:hypothetical protein [Streptomyces europaeiscabiei]|nr:hypothetical protein [Streptomyces europaeiscabiei]MDX3587021.1 hypothetical protein [Streptomyces europaeiscabiei]MDX3613428.1 hypothetical protein [Streptomyces europaeiscabiei]MDX3633647.1 hypothetical protein [Streptomyces europaeiscabiei]MDX3651054.1 hypothetical protein [Streptomyces europaeiscabiei]
MLWASCRARGRSGAGAAAHGLAEGTEGGPAIGDVVVVEDEYVL